MDSGVGDFAAGVEAGDGCSGVEISVDSAAGVVLGGDNRNPFAVDVDADFGEFLPDGWEFGFEFFCGYVGGIEINAPGGEFLNFSFDGAGDDISWGEFEAVIVIDHESSAFVVAEGSAGSAHGFGDEESRELGVAEGCGVELLEFH